MDFLILGFVTGLSLILALGAQNIFVIEQGLKKQYIFIVCLICSLSDFILIFFGIFLFDYFSNFINESVELIFNILLLLFLIYFISTKIKFKFKKFNYNLEINKSSAKLITLKTLGFTYLNPHVYSDTVFFLGNFSKKFLIDEKYFFGLGASFASFLFFFSIGYLSKYFSKYLDNIKVWKFINLFIIVFMSILALYVLNDILN